MTSDAQAILVAILMVVLAIVAFIVVAAQRRRSQRLRERFGPEYDRTVQASGDRKHAEHELSARERRREDLDIRPLTDMQRDRYVRDFKAVQAQFVDDPRSALAKTDSLLLEVMEARGYPTGDFRQQASDLSVDYGENVNDYRRAHAIVADASHASTEDLRSAMVIYRSLFDRLAAERPAREPASPRA